MLQIIIGFVVVFLVVFFVWRLLSHVYVIPCPAWLSWMVELDNPFTKVNRARAIVALLDVKPGMHVADVGCGPGRVTIPLAHAVGSRGSVTAVDIQEEMLAKVKIKAHAAHLSNITYLHAGIGQQMLPSKFFDRIVLVTVLGEIPESQKAFIELYGALKDGGILSVTEVIFDPHFQRQKTVRQLAQKVGFKEYACHGSWYAYTMQFQK